MRALLPRLQFTVPSVVWMWLISAPLLGVWLAGSCPSAFGCSVSRSDPKLSPYPPPRLMPEPAPAIEEPASATLPFSLYCGYLIVFHGSAGPLKNLSFLLDTGTSIPIFDPRIAKKLHLPGDTPASIIILGGRARGAYTTLPSMSFGPVQRSNLPVVVADLSFFRSILPVRIDAVVGLDVMGQMAFVIDYAARIIGFGPPPSFPFSIPLRLDRGLITFDAEVDQAHVQLAFDTAAASLVLFEASVLQAPLKGVDAVQDVRDIGKFPNKAILLGSVTLGHEEFRQKSAILVSNPKPSQIDFDGLVSPPALGISRVFVDLKGERLAFSR